jgi:hypothetical protein
MKHFIYTEQQDSITIRHDIFFNTKTYIIPEWMAMTNKDIVTQLSEFFNNAEVGAYILHSSGNIIRIQDNTTK